MKKHRRLFTLALTLLLALAALPGTALAADAEDTPAVLYPAEIRTSEENGVIRLEKVYYLSTHDDPAAIPTEDFDREGRHYTLLDGLQGLHRGCHAGQRHQRYGRDYQNAGAGARDCH